MCAFMLVVARARSCERLAMLSPEDGVLLSCSPTAGWPGGCGAFEGLEYACEREADNSVCGVGCGNCLHALERRLQAARPAHKPHRATSSQNRDVHVHWTTFCGMLTPCALRLRDISCCTLGALGTSAVALVVLAPQPPPALETPQTPPPAAAMMHMNHTMEMPMMMMVRGRPGRRAVCAVFPTRDKPRAHHHPTHRP